MKIELVEFYPVEKVIKRFLGTVHIYIIDYGIDVRGICVFRSGKRLMFRFPSQVSYDKETGKKVVFPAIGFSNPKHQSELFSLLNEHVAHAILATLKAQEEHKKEEVELPSTNNKKPSQGPKNDVPEKPVKPKPIWVGMQDPPPCHFKRAPIKHRAATDSKPTTI